MGTSIEKRINRGINDIWQINLDNQKRVVKYHGHRFKKYNRCLYEMFSYKLAKLIGELFVVPNVSGGYISLENKLGNMDNFYEKYPYNDDLYYPVIVTDYIEDLSYLVDYDECFDTSIHNLSYKNVIASYCLLLFDFIVNNTDRGDLYSKEKVLNLYIDGFKNIVALDFDLSFYVPNSSKREKIKEKSIIIKDIIYHKDKQVNHYLERMINNFLNIDDSDLELIFNDIYNNYDLDNCKKIEFVRDFYLIKGQIKDSIKVKKIDVLQFL